MQHYSSAFIGSHPIISIGPNAPLKRLENKECRLNAPLSKFYTCLLRVTTFQPENYHLPQLPVDVSRKIFSYIEESLSKQLHIEKIFAEVENTFDSICKKISESESKYIKMYLNDYNRPYTIGTNPHPYISFNFHNGSSYSKKGMMNKYKFSNEAFQNLVSVRIQLILDNWKDKWVYQWTSNKQKLLHNIDYDYACCNGNGQVFRILFNDVTELQDLIHKKIRYNMRHPTANITNEYGSTKRYITVNNINYTYEHPQTNYTNIVSDSSDSESDDEDIVTYEETSPNLQIAA